MTTALGVDWATDMAGDFGNDLFDASFTVRTPGAYSSADPAGPPSSSDVDYTCKAIAFGFAHELIDGELVRRGDYKVTILLGTIKTDDDPPVASTVTPRAGDTVSCPPPNSTTPQAGTVIGVLSISQAAIALHVRGA